jgi:hypothetical protein
MALDVENAMSAEERNRLENKYWIEIRKERYLQVEQINNALFNRKEEEEESDNDDTHVRTKLIKFEKSKM